MKKQKSFIHMIKSGKLVLDFRISALYKSIIKIRKIQITYYNIRKSVLVMGTCFLEFAYGK
jgi:hypothetical protein